MKSIIYLTIIALATLTSCNTADSKQQEENHEEHTPSGIVVLNEQQRNALHLKLGPVQMRNLTTAVKINGELQVPPDKRADVSVAIGGNVKGINVFLGDKVRKGQLLAVLEHPDYVTLQEDFAVISSQLDYLEKDYERQKELFENNVGSGKDYQQAKADYNTAKAKYEGLRSRLLLLNLSPEKVKNGIISNTVGIYAPINGYVNKINIKIGSYADATNKLFEITDNSAIHADFMVYENDVHLLREGQKIHFTVSSLPDKELTATVFAIGKEFDEKIRAVHIHAKIDGNTEGLIPGMYITGHLHADKTYTQALPNEAIVKKGVKSYIFVRDDKALADMHTHENDRNEEEHGEENGHDEEDDHLMAFKMTEVITGRKDDGFTEIKFTGKLPDNAEVALNAAYYLLAEMNKEETGHEH